MSAVTQKGNPAMLKTLLVHIPSERLMRPVIESAVSLARTHGAHLKAISIGYEMANVGVAFGGAGAGVAAIFEVERERAEARANAALAVFETEARSAGITYSLEPLINTPFEAANTIGASARLHDLSIVLQPERDRDTFDNVVPLEIMILVWRPGSIHPPYT